LTIAGEKKEKREREKGNAMRKRRKGEGCTTSRTLQIVYIPPNEEREEEGCKGIRKKRRI